MIPTKSWPSYHHCPIRSLGSLSRALSIPSNTLNELASQASSLYRPAKAIVKADGSIRQPFDAMPPLKTIHRKIQLRIFSHVWFPTYLTGSLKGKDAIRNAAIHAGKKIVVTEDIKEFFPSIGFDTVRSIWAGFFRFSEDVADLLTRLCVKDGSLPQGAITSSYLANLAFWSEEPKLFEDFRDEGIAYSRYVDDVTFSSRNALDSAQLARCISRVYGLMASHGLKPKRRKQEIQRSHAPMRATKLIVNARPSLPVQERQRIRASVYQLEHTDISLLGLMEFRSRVNSTAGRVARLAQLHPKEGHALKDRVTALRLKLTNVQDE